MNKRGSFYLAFLSALIILIVGFAVANLIMPEITNARTDLSCSNAAGITDGTKIMCLTVGGSLIYFIILIVSIGVGIIVDKVI